MKAVKQQGKRVVCVFFEGTGLNPELKLLGPLGRTLSVIGEVPSLACSDSAAISSHNRIVPGKRYAASTIYPSSRWVPR